MGEEPANVGGLSDALLWDHGNREHATRHGVSKEEIDGMYESGEWIVNDDPQGRTGQYRLVGPTPAGRLVTIAVEWIVEKQAYRPISAWDAVPSEREAWHRAMFEET